jgi:hypothetical protein
MRYERGRSPREPRSGAPSGPLEAGRTLRDRRSERLGTVLEVACQYAHPKADPVYNYLVRWEDGQVEAFTEAALDGSHELEIVDDLDRGASEAEASRNSSLPYDDTR